MSRYGPPHSSAYPHRTRNQWTAAPEFTDSHSTTNSSASSRTYHHVANTPSENYYQEPIDATGNYVLAAGGGYTEHTYVLPRDHHQPPTAKYHHHHVPPQQERPPIYLNQQQLPPTTMDGKHRAHVYNQQDARTRQMQGYFAGKLQQPEPTAVVGVVGPRGPSPHYDVVEGPALNRMARHPYHQHHAAGSSRATSDRPITPVSVAATDGGVDACGGHCVAFENFCHYCLQVLFIAGILTGISLTIAGSVLRGQKRGGDLMVLVYIGCLIAMVCTLLLSVQCCVRRNVKRRKRARRARIARAAAAAAGEPIPLQDLGGGVAGDVHHDGGHGFGLVVGHPQPMPPPCVRSAQQYEPLLRRLVEQQISDENQRYPPDSIVSAASRATPEDLSGVPWWRRQGQDLPRKP